MRRMPGSMLLLSGCAERYHQLAILDKVELRAKGEPEQLMAELDAQLVARLRSPLAFLW